MNKKSQIPTRSGPVRIGLYKRISTDEVHQPYSLGAQTDRLDSYVRSQEDWKIVRSYEDQMTGTVLERPGLQAALQDASKGIYDLLLVFRVDRLARSVRSLASILEQLDEHGVAFRSATEPFDTSTPAGRMMVQMLGVFAEFERATLIERVVAGMTKKAAQGGWNGGPKPLGYTYNAESGCLEIDENERGIVETIFHLYVSERKGSSAIARWLNQNGMRTKRGALWRAKTVRIVLTNPAYIGQVPWQGSVYPGKHVPIIQQTIFDQAQEILRERSENAEQRRRNISEYPLAGLLRCSRCGSVFVGTGANGNGGKYRYYTCRKRQQYGTSVCDQSTLPADRLEKDVFDHLISTLQDSQLLKLALDKFEESWRHEAPRHDAELKKCDASIRKVRAQGDRYLRAFENETMPADACGIRLRELSVELADLEVRREELLGLVGEQPEPLRIKDVREAAKKVAGLLHQYEGASGSKLKSLLRMVMPEIEVKDRRDIRPSIGLPMVLIMGSSVGPRGLEPRPPD